jgi:putative transposase
MRFPFIAEHSQQYPVTLLCQVLDVSVSGYYAWRDRPLSQHCREDAKLSAEIQQIFLDHRQVYGSPRIHAVLKVRGIHCSRKRVVRLMHHLGLSAQLKKRRKPTTKSDLYGHGLLIDSIGSLRLHSPIVNGSRIRKPSKQRKGGCSWP